MGIRPSSRVEALEKYAFAELDVRVARLKADGRDPIDFGVGDPTSPTPEFILKATARGLGLHRAEGYPSYIGEPPFREIVCAWMKNRLGVNLDPERQTMITVGSKEAIFHLPEAFVNPGEIVISPSPGYPPYTRGALFAEGRNYLYPLIKENDFLPDLDAIPKEIAKEARIFWICQPHVPTGRIAPKETLSRLIDFCAQHEIILCSDEAYIDHYYTEAPESLIQHGQEGVLAFYSLSKRSSMTGYRCGWVAGDADAIALFKQLKTNIDSGVPRFVQDGAMSALCDEEHVRELRAEYKEARDRMLEALTRVGLPRCAPQAGLYIWQRAPEGKTGLDLAQRLLEPDLALVATPGVWLAEEVEGMENPGAGYVRFSLTPTMDRIEEAVRRLAALPEGGLLL